MTDLRDARDAGPDHPGAAAGKTILIVDDQPLCRAVLLDVLGNSGARLLEASGAAAALDLARRERPDLIITDIVMPGADGYELVRRLRADPATAATPVIFHTACYSAEETQRLARPAGVASVLTKPAEPEAVLRAVADALRLPRGLTVLDDSFDREHLQVVTEKLAQKVEQLEAANRRLAGLVSLGLRLAEEQDQGLLLRHFCEAARGLCEVRRAVVAFRDDGDGLRYWCSDAAGDPDPWPVPALVHPALLAWLLEANRPAHLPAVAAQAAALGLGATLAGMASLLWVPVASRSQRYGALALLDRDGGGGFTADDERLARTLAAQLALRYENSLRYEIAREYAARQEAVREDERARIAREIHDELGQSLTGLRIDLCWLKGRLAHHADGDPARGAPLLDRTDGMLALVRTTLEDVHRIATELRPPVLDDLGLAAAIEWQVVEFEKRTAVCCALANGAAAVSLGRDRDASLFRILQEALTNVARHAGATAVTIRLWHDGPRLALEVRDNGKGMPDVHLMRKGALGLLGMRERAAFLEGELLLSSAPGQGTTVAVRVPLRGGARPEGPAHPAAGGGVQS